MHSPTLGLTWQIWYRHRWGFAAVVAYVVVWSALLTALPAGTFGTNDGSLLSILMVFGLIYMAAAFAYGFDSQVEGRESGFPARLFTLPVRTRVLVGWPMLQGTLTVALLWAAWCCFVLWPTGTEVAVLPTALLAAACVAWLQALMWRPFGLPWGRVLVALPTLTPLVLAPVFGPLYGVTETALVVVYVAVLAAAYAVTVTSVARARRGDVPHWGGPLRRVTDLLSWRPWARRGAQPFPSAARAQLWYEWRCHGVFFPMIVGFFLALHLAFVLWVETNRTSKIGLGWNLLYMPCVLALFSGSFASSFSPFLATRPMTCAAVVAAKFKAAALSALAVWALTANAALVWLLHTEAYREVPALWEHFTAIHGTAKVCAALALAVAGPVLLTWALIAGQMFIGLTGRKWVLYGSQVLAFTCLLAVLWSLGIWKEYLAERGGLFRVLAWVGGVLVALKLLAAGCIWYGLDRSGLLKRPTLMGLLLAWVLAAAGLFGLLAWLVPAERVPLYLLAFAAVLILPIARLGTAPLALAWNRHR
jgi:hypothetical protein